MAVVAALVAFGVAGARASLLERRARLGASPNDLYYGLPGGALRLVSLRYREALADLLWVRALLYFGERGESDQPPRHIHLHLQAVLELDPWFERAYSTAATLSRRRPVPERVALTTAIDFLDRGFRRFPTNWRFPFFIAAYYTEMPAGRPEEAAQYRLRAADWVQRAALIGAGRGAPDWLPNLAATLLTETGEREMALRYLEESLLTAPDEATRIQVRAKITQLRGRVEADMLAHQADEFLRKWKDHYPYVPGDLFVLLGSRPPQEPFDLAVAIDRAIGVPDSGAIDPR